MEDPRWMNERISCSYFSGCGRLVPGGGGVKCSGSQRDQQPPHHLKTCSKCKILKTSPRPPESEPRGWGPIIHISLKIFKGFLTFHFEIVWDLPKKLQNSTVKASLYRSPSFPQCYRLTWLQGSDQNQESDVDTTLLPDLQTLSKSYQLSHCCPFLLWDPIQDYIDTLYLAAMLPYSLEIWGSSSVFHDLCTFEASSLVIL